MTRRPKRSSPSGPHEYRTQLGPSVVCDVSLLPLCRLKKLATLDDYWAMREDRVWIGKTYPYLPGSQSVRTFFNHDKQQEFSCEVVLVYDDRLFGFLPTELLELGPA